MSYVILYYHFVFRTKCNLRVIDEDAADRLYRYINGISSNLGCTLLKVNGMPDHIHIAVSLNPDVSPADYMREVKSSSSKWIADNKLFPGFHGWGKSYFGSTFSSKDRGKVESYIANQQIHHRKMTMREELESFFSSLGMDDKLQYFLRD